ncbi:hypothetical protein Ahy_B06g081903 isoform C [Arachis hypogaea]|uniref:Carbohydrate kinase PfkB domain-containing protein n=1 Tax=Arachis hypogaea TaxID=3818 RepID=A0A444YMC3_ARAHY|nr:hypothetical protein Ahy_B06g081903 isoform C [Arachis hypogaea]
MPAELPESTLFSALSGAGIVFLDGRLNETALVVAHEVWAGATTIPKALVSMVLRLPKVKFVIVTLGKDGCIMLERSVDEGASREEADVDRLLESLEMKRNRSTYMPTCISSSVTKLQAEGIGTVCGRLYVGTAENIPPSELIDTTGAGDAFAGAVLYALCANFSRENMLCFAATVVSSLCNGGSKVQSSRRTKWPSTPYRSAARIIHAVDFYIWTIYAWKRSQEIHINGPRVLSFQNQ